MNLKKSKRIVIVGTGPAALMAGTKLAERGFQIDFYDQKKAPARKFLVAGHGGFNLSNSIDKLRFLAMYDRQEIQKMVDAFDADDLVQFLQKISIPTYIGSSGKVFPEKDIKPINVLQNWLQYLESMNAQFHFQFKMKDFDENAVYFDFEGEQRVLQFDKLILALGGASWTKTGSDGQWWPLFQKKQINVLPFQSSNAGFEIDWSTKLKSYAGAAIKHIVCRLGTLEKKGEVVVTEYGLEGAPIYFLNAAFRNGNTELTIDAKPDFDLDKIARILNSAKNPSEGLRRLKLNSAIISLVKEQLSKEAFLDAEKLSAFLKNIPLNVSALRPIEEAISTVGGISFDAVNEDLSLKQFSNIYCCGEMLDWDAPTGGYLLQACIASGHWIGEKLSFD